MFTLYGIPNCDTVKKARTWLENNGIEYQFHDYKKEGISAKKLKGWLKEFPKEKLVNKASTTWKGLTEEQKLAITNDDAAIDLMTESTSVIKRPLVENQAGKAIALGFSAASYEEKFL